jgi:hypothetical protein
MAFESPAGFGIGRQLSSDESVNLFSSALFERQELESYEEALLRIGLPHVTDARFQHHELPVRVQPDAADGMLRQRPGGLDQRTATADVVETNGGLGGDGPTEPTDDFKAKPSPAISHG